MYCLNFLSASKGQYIIAQGIVSGGTNRNATLGKGGDGKNRPHDHVNQNKNHISDGTKQIIRRKIANVPFRPNI